MFQRTRDYAKDYEKIGSIAHYRGKYFRFTIEQPALKRRKAAFVLCLAFALVFFAFIGFSDSPALGAGGHASAIYVILPYVALLLPLGLGFARALLLAFKSAPLEYAEYDKYMVQQKPVLLVSLILSFVLLVGELAFAFFGGEEIGTQIMPLIEAALCSACIFTAFRQYHTLFQSIAIDENKSVRYDI